MEDGSDVGDVVGAGVGAGVACALTAVGSFTLKHADRTRMATLYFMV
jgi:hypothetical protein